jgi:predicted CXXCH cytochrome family protein
LLTAYRHAPVHSGACDACHQPEQPDHKFPLKRAGSEACTFCHPVMGHAAHAHQVITSEGCTPCHDPHGSNAKFLLTRMSTELVCQQCHSIERKSHLHGPFAAGECTACHQAHESDNRFLLRGGEGKDHCLLCHKDKQQQLLAVATVHKPVQEGCTGCHEAHSSDYESMLNAPIEELCFKCHEDVEGKVADAKSPHGAVFTGHRCANCHDPHAEGRRYLLRDDLRTLCLQCHDRPQKAYDGRTIPDMRKVLTERKSLHGPVQSGECEVCHEVHGSSNVKLLAKFFPPQFYQAFDLASYALCFQCHSKAIVLEKQTTSLTNFRDGDRNLHHLHVNRPEKGRTCRTCHEIHGSNLPRHMAAQVQFEGGGWPMPIRFEETPNGGRCSPGCHQPYEYNRLRPSTRPSTRPSGEEQR